MTVKELRRELRRYPGWREVYVKIMDFPERDKNVISRSLRAEQQLDGKVIIVPWNIRDLSREQLEKVHEYLEGSDHGDTDT